MTRRRCHGRCQPTASALAVALGLALALGCTAETRAPAPASEQRSLLVEVNWEPNVELEALRDSVHQQLECPDCHARIEERHLDAKKPLAENLCQGCHRKADAALALSVHGAAGSEKGARCQDCHGAHDVRPVKDRQSSVNKKNVAKTCAKCHDNPLFFAELDPGNKQVVGQYAESIHGKKLLDKGMLKSPSCTDCHGGGHDVQEVKDAKSGAQKAAVMAMCDSCHSGITKTFSGSAHGKALAKGDENAPTCASCHSAHAVSEKALAFRLGSDRQCGSCHEERFGAHLETYHGRAHALGGAKVATCFDCHGSHDVLPSKDPASMVSAERKLDTCRSCHADAPANLAGYLPHGDPHDRAAFPLLYWANESMTWLIRAALALLVLHSSGWMLRNLLDFARDPDEYREARWRRMREARRDYAPAFRGIDRACYTLLLVSFVLLVVTGLPLGFNQTAWAKELFGLLGGADTARSLHRLGAVSTVAYAALHLGSLIAPLWQRRGQYRDEAGRFRLGRFCAVVFGPESPLPNPRDLGSFWAHARWLFGRGPEPRFERYRYWEKLDYLALLLGISVIAASGFVMWAPELALLVLPGSWVNLAQIIHHEQALLVLVTILSAHVCHLVPRVFAPRTPSRARARRAVSLARSALASGR